MSQINTYGSHLFNLSHPAYSTCRMLFGMRRLATATGLRVPGSNYANLMFKSKTKAMLKLLPEQNKRSLAFR